MQGIWLENQTLQVRDDIPIPIPSNAEALIRVALAGICSTDLEMVKGYYPYTGVLGHEFVGKIIEAPGNSAWIGKRVVGEINISCGECKSCSSDFPTHCVQRTVLGIKNLNGAFAEYLTLPLSNLHLVPDAVSGEEAVFAEPLAAALEIQEQIHIHPSDQVLVIGAGRLGQLIAQTMALTGCGLQVVVRHAYQKKVLADFNIPSITEDQISIGEMDIVVEATGTPGGFITARKAVRPRGTIVLKSTYKGDFQVNFSSIVVDEITLVGSRCGPFGPALRLMNQKQIDPRPLISARYPLSNGAAAFDRAAQPGVFKILFQMRDD